MPDLLLELRSEEIPARMQRKAAGDLKKLVTDALVEAGLTYEGAREHFTARRLTLDIRGVTAKSADISEERKGPRTDAPAKAIEGFLRGAGLASIDEAKVASDPKKGDFYLAVIEKPGRRAEEIIAEVMPGIIRNFPWPKSMRWGKASAEPGSLRWVRPLQSIVCTFGPETEEPVVIDFEVDGIRSGNVTYGHRFHAPGPITVRRFDDYAEKLHAARVVLDAERRKDMILTDARNRAFASGLELVEDEALLEEVAGLVEWPVVLMGEFEEEFLEIPAEVIRLTIKANQKCFVLANLSPTPPHKGEGPSRSEPAAGAEPQTSPLVGEVGAQSATGGGTSLANRFILVSNIEAKDGGAEIARGNGKVVRARLSDALYFWTSDQRDLPDLEELRPSAERLGLDLSKPLDQRMAKLDHLGVTFHAKLGTQGERVERIRRLARELAPIVGADPEKVDRAVLLAKADLTTEAVGEFPELQGLMGRRYAELQGEDPAVAAAIEDHYKPLGPTDTVPSDPVTIAVALADKLDMLVGFWAIDEKPTGSKDPYALRRAALGVIRLVLENRVRLGHETEADGYRALSAFVSSSIAEVQALARIKEIRASGKQVEALERGAVLPSGSYFQFMRRVLGENGVRQFLIEKEPEARRIATELFDFLHDRLKVYLRDEGARYDLIDAVLGAERPSSGPAGHLLPKGEKRNGGPALHLSKRHVRLGDAEREQDGAPTTSSPLRGEGGPRSGSGERPRAPGNDDLLAVTQRVQALGQLLDTEDGKNLLAGTKRAANILAAEEKKGTRIAASVDPSLFTEDEEKALFAAVDRVEKEAASAIANEDYAGAMRALADLRAPIDSFFDKVLVNDENADVRANRLALLDRIRTATSAVADFSRIVG